MDKLIYKIQIMLLGLKTAYLPGYSSSVSFKQVGE
jgi:hypothetical protein